MKSKRSPFFQKMALALCAVCLLVATVAPIALAAETGTPQAVVGARNGTVRIVCLMGTGSASAGTGFAVGVGNDVYIISNQHVIQDASEVLIYYNTGEYVQATVYAEVPGRDLCILIPQEPIEGLTILPLQTGVFDVGLAVYALGYPGAADDFGKSFNASQLDTIPADKEMMTLSDGIISAFRESPIVGDLTRDNVQLVQTNAAINSGNSGGPLLDSEGNVVGINTLKSGRDATEGVNFSIHVRELIAVLREENIAFTEPVLEMPELPAEQGGNGMLRTLLIVGIVLVAAGAIIALVLRRSSQDKKGISLAAFQRQGRAMNETTAYAFTLNFVNELLASGNVQSSVEKLTPNSVWVGKQQLSLQPAGEDGGSADNLFAGYSAPEVYRGNLDEPAGVYFIGTMLYTLLTGKRARDGLTRLEQNSPLFQPANTLQTIVNKAAEPHEQNRIATLAQLRDALYAAQAQIYAEQNRAQPLPAG